MLNIAPAGLDDLSTVLGVLDEAAAWLRKQGIEQWPARFSGAEDWRETRIRSYVDAGQTWLVRDGDQVLATFTTGGADPHYAHGWPDGPDTGLYVYRMAVRRAAAGRGLGERILDWCSTRAAGDGYRWLRLDCHRHNRRLQRYYEARGFERVGTVVHTIPDGADGKPYVRGSGALYQRPAVADDDTPTERQVTTCTAGTGQASP